MITDADIKFHTPNDAPFDWAETGYFNFYIPEANILGFIYIVHRAGVGATISDIEIFDGKSTSPLDTIYIDLCNHNRIVPAAEKFALQTGLEFEARSIREYAIRYARQGIELDAEFISIMEPYDIHDRSMDPMATSDAAAAVEHSGFGTAYTAHFDMSVQVRGHLTIDGTRHAIDCVATMDHSWGPRPENGFSPINWTNAHFGPDYCLHAIFAYAPDAPPGAQHDFKHGYALIDGKVRGATASSFKVLRDGPYSREIEWCLTDVDGREHSVIGEAVNHHNWQPYGNNLSPIEMARWRTSDGRIGWGTHLDGIPLNAVRRTKAP